ncbi:hypothetical protein OS493_029534 [Desmophyllum pertusum]|uniref:Uncharacterized protein n=1 Tax=Desmophyllum pertusum TaxID=174260 RepID=A0A9W9Y999_9CNID|nr:hypothetical protein OS493_029534 [Desmophyllum pertusum]
MPRCNDITSIQVEQPNADIEALRSHPYPGVPSSPSSPVHVLFFSSSVMSIQIETAILTLWEGFNIQNCYVDVVGWFVWVDGPVHLWSFGILCHTGSNLARQAIGRVFSLKPVSSQSSRSGFEYEVDNLTHTNESHRTTRNLQLIGC